MSKQIELTQGRVAIIDDRDFDELSGFKWYAHRDHSAFYAERNIRLSSGERSVIKMHTQITGYDTTDHIDGDGLNNQRDNLRECTHGENSHNSRKPINNTSGYKGVYFNKQRRKFRAQIKVNNAQKHLGYFELDRDAAIAYNDAAIKFFGEFARLNEIGSFPISQS